MKKTKKLLAFILGIVTILSSIPMSSAVYAEEEEWIEIRTVEDLYNIRYNMDANYRLMNDLDLSDALGEGGEYNFMDGNGWEPIGSDGKYSNIAFTGTFDGGFHSIKNLWIAIKKKPSLMSECNIGLFANNKGTIQNLYLVDCNIGNDWILNIDNIQIGTLCAINSGTISNVLASGESDINITHTGNNSIRIGGLTGSNSGIIDSCGNLVQLNYNINSYVTSTERFAYIGGVAGSSSKMITNCYNKSNISCAYLNSNSGGRYLEIALAGITIGKTANCYNTGDVKGEKKAKGNASCFAYGLSSTIEEGGGYNVGLVKSDLDNGGYPTAASSAVRGIYYLNNWNYSSSYAEGFALNSTQMTNPTFFEGFDFENTWAIDPQLDYKYPYLQWEDPVDAVEWKEKPTTTDYCTTSDKLDVSGGKLKVYLKDGSTKIVDVLDSMVSGYDLTSVGTQTVTVSYHGKTLTYGIDVIDKGTLESLQLVSMPTKTSFVRGTEFDFTGCKVKATYDSGIEDVIDVTADMTTGGDILNSGIYAITYSFLGESVSFNVEVVPVDEEALVVSTLPSKTSYYKGEELDLDGMVVKVKRNDGSFVETSAYTVEGDTSEIGQRTIKVTYDNNPSFYDTFAINVVKSVQGCEIVIDDSSVYDGEEKTPSVLVKDGNSVLTEGEDYTVSYSNNVIAGTDTASATIVGIGEYVGTKVVNYSIGKAIGIAAFDKTTVSKSFGDAKFVNFLTTNCDGAVTYSSSNEDVATIASNGLVTIVGNGTTIITASIADGVNYKGTVLTYVLLVKKPASRGDFAEPVVVKDVGDAAFINPFTSSTDGMIVYSSSNENIATVDSSTGEVTIVGGGTVTISANMIGCTNYADSKATYRLIVNKHESSMSFLNSTIYAEFGGSNFTNALTYVSDGDLVFTSNNWDVATVNPDGEVTIRGAGTATIVATVTGGTNYTDNQATYQVVVSPKNINGITLSLDKDTYVYSGNENKPKLNEITSDDYTVTYSSNVNAGTATATFVGKRNYTGAKTITFSIEKADQNVNATDKTIVLGKTGTVGAIGYGALSYESSDSTIATVNAVGVITAKKIGTCNITISAAGDENHNAGNTVISVMVVPVTPTGITLTNTNTGVTVKWTKVADATGYKVYKSTNGSTYSLLTSISSNATVSYNDAAAKTNGGKCYYKVVAVKKVDDVIYESAASAAVLTYRLTTPAISSATNSAKGAVTVKWAKNASATGYEVKYVTGTTTKTVKITSASTVSKVISSLSKGKTYKIYLRAYKTVSGKTYYSNWSAAKSIKITK